MTKTACRCMELEPRIAALEAREKARAVRVARAAVRSRDFLWDLRTLLEKHTDEKSTIAEIGEAMFASQEEYSAFLEDEPGTAKTGD